MATKNLYKITFSNQGKLYEIYAKSVSNSNLLGFIEIESLVFGEKTSLVVDPSEEKIKTEFEGVKRTYIPMHSVLRIDEVDKEGVSKISKAEGNNVTQLSNTVFVPDGKSKT
jgi:hypothetical protein